MNADALICSHPRSGGRWLRYLIGYYLAEHYRLGVKVTPRTVFGVVPDHHDERRRGYPAFRFAGHEELPLVAVCHQPHSWEHHRGYPMVFLARNAYDVVVSAYFHLTREKTEYRGAMRDFLEHPTLGLPAWIDYMNRWAPELLGHRDRVLVSYGELSSDPGGALRRVLGFLDVPVEEGLLGRAVESGNALRRVRGIRTGQEGNFWDHLQPPEIFEIQAILRRDLSDPAAALLESMGVELDPFPRADAGG